MTIFDYIYIIPAGNFGGLKFKILMLDLETESTAYKKWIPDC